MEIEELVLQIQQGNTIRITELWEKVRSLIAWYAGRYFILISLTNICTPGGVEVDDLVQSSYFALLDAIKAYDPARGSFTTLLSYYLKKQFREAIGLRTSKRNPLDNYLSLDIPIDENDPDSATWLEFVPDSRDNYAGVDNAIFREQLRTALERALDAIPEKEAYALRAEYFRGLGGQKTAYELGVSFQRVHQLCNDGLRHIRSGSNGAQLERFLDFETPYYKTVSVHTFNRTHTSAVEALVLSREKRREELGNCYCSSQ